MVFVYLLTVSPCSCYLNCTEILYFKCTCMNPLCYATRCVQSDYVSSHWERSKRVWMFRCENTMILTIRCFHVANFTTVITFTCLFSCKLSFLIVGLKMSSVPSFPLKYPENIDVVLRELMLYLLWFLAQSVPWDISFILSWCMHIWSNNITPVTPLYYIAFD